MDNKLLSRDEMSNGLGFFAAGKQHLNFKYLTSCCSCSLLDKSMAYAHLDIGITYVLIVLIKSNKPNI